MNVNNLHCIDLDQPQLQGFRRFISAWLIKDPNFSAVVDPGPLSTIPELVKQLRRHGVDRLDYVLLTHIHIDHAGGCGELLKYFPQAQVICHDEGIRHMVEPAQLWQGSLKVLGEMAQIYGEIVAVAADRIHFMTQIQGTGIRVHKTPGHAPHHLCFQYQEVLFGGEVCGVHSPLTDTSVGIYMRPATPPRFILDVAIDSLDRMIALAPKALVIGHYGLVEPALDYLKMGRQQLFLWLQGVASTADFSGAAREQAIYDWLIAHDPLFQRIEHLDADIMARERYFMGNSLRGMLDYFSGLSAHEQAALATGKTK